MKEKPATPKRNCIARHSHESWHITCLCKWTVLCVLFGSDRYKLTRQRKPINLGVHYLHDPWYLQPNTYLEVTILSSDKRRYIVSRILVWLCACVLYFIPKNVWESKWPLATTRKLPNPWFQTTHNWHPLDLGLHRELPRKDHCGLFLRTFIWLVEAIARMHPLSYLGPWTGSQPRMLPL